MQPLTGDEGGVPVDRGASVPEVEWQFDAVDLRPVERWLRTPVPGITVDPAGRVHQQVDLYADTADWRLHRGGYSLRIRRRAGRLEATLKSIAPAEDALRRRTELSAKVPSPDLDGIALLDAPLGRIVRAMTGSHALVPVVEIRTRRKTFGLSVDGARVGEIVLDATTIPIEQGQEPARLQRLEVEVAPEAVERVRPFVEMLRDACGLSAASMSKLEAGLFAAGRSPSAYLEFGPTDVYAHMSTGELAFAVLREQFALFLRKESGTRVREDPEELHDMRVATRRIRAALGLFAGALPVRAGRFREEFRWVADALGRVRDLDVQLVELDGWVQVLPVADRASLEVLRALLEDHRRTAEEAMIAALDSARYERLVAGFAALLRRGPLRRAPASRTPILIAAPDIVSRRYRKVRRAGDKLAGGAGPDGYHKLRVRTKRLRYALEFTAPIYGKRATTFIRQLSALQDLLGEHQDAQVAVERLRSFLEASGDELPPAAVFAMGRIAERYASRSGDLRTRFDQVYGPLRKGWRRLRSRMEARREALGWRPPRPAEPASISQPAVVEPAASIAMHAISD